MRYEVKSGVKFYVKHLESVYWVVAKASANHKSCSHEFIFIKVNLKQLLGTHVDSQI